MFININVNDININVYKKNSIKDCPENELLTVNKENEIPIGQIIEIDYFATPEGMAPPY